MSQSTNIETCPNSVHEPPTSPRTHLLPMESADRATGGSNHLIPETTGVSNEASNAKGQTTPGISTTVRFPSPIPRRLIGRKTLPATRNRRLPYQILIRLPIGIPKVNVHCCPMSYSDLRCPRTELTLQNLRQLQLINNTQQAITHSKGSEGA